MQVEKVAGKTIRQSFSALESERSDKIGFRNTTNKTIIMLLINSERISPDETIPCAFFGYSLFVSATCLDTVSGIPELEIIVSKPKTAVAIEKSPIICAPNSRDRYILKTKEIVLVNTEKIITNIAVLRILFFIQFLLATIFSYRYARKNIYITMIIRLKKGETLEYIAKISALDVQKIIEQNGFTPSCGQYFYLDRQNKYIVGASDNVFVISKKTKLTVKEITDRVNVCKGKVFYY